MYSTHRYTLGPRSAAERVRLLLFVSVLVLDRVRGHAAARGLHRRRMVTAQWLPQYPTRGPRESGAQDIPDRGEILLSSQDLQLVLQVEHNQELLAPGFTETFYTSHGEPVTLTNHSFTDHCYYHGNVQGHPESWTALSTCSGFRAFISLNATHIYYLEPLSGAEPSSHLLLSAPQLSITEGRCGHEHPPPTQSNIISHTLRSLAPRVKRSVRGTTKYVELFIVADNTLFKRMNQDYDKTKARIMEIANYVDKFYRALNVRVPLVGLEVWTDRDQCVVSEQPSDTLWSFLRWRQTLRARQKHDNAQLLTGVVFKGTTIGMAPLEGMCSTENSGGINVDHSELALGAAATMAHEMGHNFGMSHDHDGCCEEASAELGGCLMAAATGHPFPRVFSRCSKRDLDSYLQRGGGMCLYNMPNMKDLVGGKKCGNGFVEDGEECDCGEPDECVNDCCHANNCTLMDGAQCAHGVCCEDCQLKQAGTMCRGPAGACDLPEYCTGASAYCPANVYLLDGSRCHHGLAYCYNGMCLTHEQQCVQLWGYGASPAHDACFEDVNAAGNAFGNCGKDRHGNYTKCEKSDAKCGKIQCHSAAKKPKGTNAVSIDTTILTNGVELKCRGTFVYSTQDGLGDLPDPGLVMTGTKCGDGKVCRERRCLTASFGELDTCMKRCHGHGVCNSNANCHCDGGWAPPFCEKPGLGGSVDSGPVHNHSQVPLVVGLLLAFLVLLPALLLAFSCSRIRTSYYHKWLQQRHANRAMETSVDQRNDGHHNPTFDLKVVQSSSRAPVHQGGGSQLSHSSREVLQLRSCPVLNGAQPVNVVRPLRDSRTPQRRARPGPPRPGPPRPARSVTFTVERSRGRRSPPRKPLPLDPKPSPWVVTSSRPPQRPLPLGPRKGSPSQASTALLVMMPQTTDPGAAARVSALPALRVLRPSPSLGPSPAPK